MNDCARLCCGAGAGAGVGVGVDSLGADDEMYTVTGTEGSDVVVLGGGD